MSDLLSINVNDHVEKKNGLAYLSWAWAWTEVLKIDPKATWKLEPFGPEPVMFFPDESAMVCVSVTIKENTKSCLLPVMDNRNKAIKKPDAFEINKAIMRCLAKAISMHGLGLYIYAGEDLPEDQKPAANLTDDQITEITTLLDGRDFEAFMQWVSKCTGQECKALKDVPAEAYTPIIKKLTQKAKA